MEKFDFVDFANDAEKKFNKAFDKALENFVAKHEKGLTWLFKHMNCHVVGMFIFVILAISIGSLK